jgi:hypothetical protein
MVSQAAAAAPSAGETYVYRLVNGYNQEVRAQVRHDVEKVESGRVTVALTPDKAEGGVARTEIYTAEGNWLQREIESHGKPVEYSFAAAYPAYAFPLEPGKTWTARVPARVSATGASRSVRVDGKVIGAERIRVPAGEFDTIKVRRFVYPGDAGDPSFTTETHVTEFEWYAPALGRPVRTERKSTWLNPTECGLDGGCDFRGNWDIYELVEAPRAAKR